MNLPPTITKATESLLRAKGKISKTAASMEMPPAYIRRASRGNSNNRYGSRTRYSRRVPKYNDDFDYINSKNAAKPIVYSGMWCKYHAAKSHITDHCLTRSRALQRIESYRTEQASNAEEQPQTLNDSEASLLDSAAYPSHHSKPTNPPSHYPLYNAP